MHADQHLYESDFKKPIWPAHAWFNNCQLTGLLKKHKFAMKGDFTFYFFSQQLESILQC